MKVAVVGYGVEGRAAVKYWQSIGATVEVHDRRSDIVLPANIQLHTDGNYLRDLESVDLVVRAPGIRPDALPKGVEVTSVTKEFFAHCPATIIGVTGTKGKGTTATTIASILQADGRNVFLGGNIGVPPLSFLSDLHGGDFVVLELSSFQLIDLTTAPHIAVVLSVTPDHLNWHRDLDEYYRAKTLITLFQSSEDSVVYVADNSVSSGIGMMSSGRRIPLGRPEGIIVDSGGNISMDGTLILNRADVPLAGAHNLVNVAAAAAASEAAGVEYASIRTGIRAMSPLPHRLNLVATINNVKYIDDSCSTTPETTQAAIATYSEPKILILGGSTKGVGFEALARASAGVDVRAILLVGSEAARIAAALDEAGVQRYEYAPASMPQLVERASAIAMPGDVVLLSPACASLERYRNYADRGEQFAAAVRRLVPDTGSQADA